MPLVPPSGLATHLAGEALTLATLWTITRGDGVVFLYTDHDKDIQFQGDIFKTGIGYNRSAIDDKADLSADNLDIKGVLASGEITSRDIRAGLFDGAAVWIRIINWANPEAGALIRRRGWLGDVRQSDLGEFDTELRGMAEALSENLSRVYTPGCVADLGSTDADGAQPACRRALVPNLRADATTYEIGQEISIADADDLIFRATLNGTTGDDPYDDEFLYASVGDFISDGTQIWETFPAWAAPVVVQLSPIPDRRTFNLAIQSAKLDADPRYYDGGLLTFSTGNNAGISREIKSMDQGSSGDAECILYLRMPFDVNPSDTAIAYPGCDKSIETCNTKFDNAINFAGFPHVPGDTYLKNYPDAKS